MTPSPRPAKRVLLGARSNFGTRQRVYRIPDGLEVEDVENFMVTCRRVFFDEVLLVTYHRYRGWAFLLMTAALGVWCGFISIGVGAGAGVEAGLGAFAVTGLPALLSFVLRLALGVDVVGVYGKRTRCRLHYWFRKRRAREVFNQICRMVRERQERLARELAAEAPPAPPGPPPEPAA